MAKDLINLALDTVNALGATYADARLIRKQEEDIKIKDNRVEVLKRDEDAGIGIRAIAQGCWGFAATAKLDKKTVERTAALAVKVAKASARLKDKDVVLSETEKVTDTFQTKIQSDPFSVPLDEKIDLLLTATKAMKKVKGVKFSEAYLNFIKKYQIFGSTQGSLIEQIIYQSGGYIDSTAIKGNITGERSYPGMHGHYKCAGYEFIKGLNFIGNAQRVAEEAVALTIAKECPKIETTVILDGSMVAIQVHETVGHPTELDRVLGTEVSLAGKSHLTPDKRNNFRMGSDIVSVTADATIEGGLGSFGYDDEGVRAQRVYLIKDGIFTGYLTSRETAQVFAEPSNGTMRASSWASIPLIRMTNINLEPGTRNLDDLLADTEDGIYFESAGNPSIDDKRLNYHIHSEIGWIIKNGRKTEIIRRPSFSGISYEIWRNCDAICSQNHWEVWGVPNCGKGDPTQTMQVGHGAAPARFRKIKVGS
ncbi:MAG: TldD/PmbA family protein [candidate division WOR-3 bacterium]|nr:TldD/PmbA family protein [candidate division WOR-3 bacterium]